MIIDQTMIKSQIANTVTRKATYYHIQIFPSFIKFLRFFIHPRTAAMNQ